MTQIARTEPACTEPHYNQGTLSVAFVFSVPGTREALAAQPIAGKTGEHLTKALQDLKRHLPQIFQSTVAYEYRITNAYGVPTSIALGHARTEVPNNFISAPTNVARVRDELVDCQLVLLCGDKAQLLAPFLGDHLLVHTGHTSASGLNSRWPNKLLDKKWLQRTSADRTGERIRMWSEQVRQQVHALIANGKLRP